MQRFAVRKLEGTTLKTVTAIICLIVIGMPMAAADTGAGETEDQVVASFEREFNHKTPAAKPATRAAIDEDVLYELVNKPLQDTEVKNELLVAKNEGGEA